uniref:LRRCT domain-containing protein n=1 Tax=Rhabditophanes sp. KR3021 TaxID=114890 RepID=A0AC35TR82_9BILA
MARTNLLLLLTLLTTNLPWVYGAAEDKGGVECPNDLNDFCECSYGVIGSKIACQGGNPEDILRRLANQYIHWLKIEDCESSPVLGILPAARIRALELVKCNLVGVSVGSFALLGLELRELTLSGNKFKTLPNLGNMPKLLSLNVAENEIADVDEKAVAGLQQLQQLRLSNNKIGNVKGVEKVSKSLRLIDLSHNHIKTLPDYLFRRFNDLRYVDLSFNEIERVSSNTFNGAGELTELRLSDNSLTDIDGQSFEGNPKLQKLILRNNGLNESTFGNLRGVGSIDYADLSGNKMEKIPSLLHFKNLTTLQLDSNAIGAIERLSLKHGGNLTKLSLEGNKISKIDENSFKTLGNLLTLGLGGNSLTVLGKDTFVGLVKIEKLGLKNNALRGLHDDVFKPAVGITALDLSRNDLLTISTKLFKGLAKLVYIDLSQNRLSVIEPLTFDRRIASIHLNANPLNCGPGMEWFMNWATGLNVRTAPMSMKEATCVVPEEFAGKGLREVVLSKVNNTITNSLGSLGATGQRNGLNFFGAGLPHGAAGIPMLTQSIQTVPVLGALSRILPGLRDIAVKDSGLLRSNGGSTDKLNSAIEDFAAPLVRMSTGNGPMYYDIEQLVQAIPKIIVHADDTSEASQKFFNISAIPPNVLAHIMKGNTIPGIDKETMKLFIDKYFSRIVNMIDRLNKGEVTEEDAAKVVPNIKTLPPVIVSSFINNEGLPMINETSIEIIKGYYMNRLSLDDDEGSEDGNILSSSPFAGKLLKLIPKGYNMKKISQSVIQEIMNGKVPNFGELPEDLQEHFKSNSADLFEVFQYSQTSMEELMKKLPNFDKSHLNRVKPYDIGEIKATVPNAEDSQKWNETVFIGTCVLLIFLLALGVIYTVYLCMKIRAMRKALPQKETIPPPNPRNMSFYPYDSSTPREQRNSDLRLRTSGDRNRMA